MSAKIVKLSGIADPSIDEVLDRFLEDQCERLAPRTFRNYEDVVELLRDCLNGYAYQSLSRQETALFERHHGAEGEARREFCQLFGPDKILDELDHFLSYFMIRRQAVPHRGSARRIPFHRRAHERSRSRDLRARQCKRMS